MMTTELLECGHETSPHDSNFTTGYGKDESGNRYCYACCQQRDIDAMRKDGRIMAYLSSDGKTITGWPGYKLATVISERETSAGGFARHTKITRVWARDTDGLLWHGRGPGRGMYIRLYRSRTQKP